MRVDRQTLDDELSTAAIAAIIATPAGPGRDLEMAAWARRIAAGPGYVAIVISEAWSAEEMQIVARLHNLVRLELGGLS